jgi:uncharacterized protein YidB (DUF937 family)
MHGDQSLGEGASLETRQEVVMGLMDILNGMQNGPRGQRQPTPTKNTGGGGMSPIMMALLALLAYKALKGKGAQPAAPDSPGRRIPLPSGSPSTAGTPGGGLGDILGGLLGRKPAGAQSGSPAGAKPGGSLSDIFAGGLGGLLGGAAAGSVLSDGLGNLIRDLQQNGHGHTVQSWIGDGPNQDIAPRDLANALGSDTLDTLTKETGLSRDDLLAGLSQFLPDLVDQLTPNGRMPTDAEAARLV